MEEIQATQEAPAQPKPPGRIRRFFARVPRAVIALGLAALLLGLFYANKRWYLLHWSWLYDALSWVILATIFFAGAIQRLSWRHFLILLPFYGVAQGAVWLLNHFGFIHDLGFYPYNWLIEPTLFLCLLFVGEFLLLKTRPWRWMLLFVVAAISAAALRGAVTNFIGAAGWEFELFKNVTVYVSDLAYWFLLAVLAWSFFVLAQRCMRRGRLGRAAAGAILLLPLVIYPIYFGYGVFALSKSSVAGNGPFTRTDGVLFLQERMNAEDQELLIGQLANADWRYGEDRRNYDWRKVAIMALSKDENSARKLAGILAPILNARRSCVLADYSADLMASQHRVEVAPVFLRYALDLPPFSGPH